MLILRVALRNLLGAGLRTWLNVIVLSFTFIIIIWLKGLLEGWDRQARNDMIRWEAGSGQFWHEGYDPYDPFTLTDGHGILPEPFMDSVKSGALAPILISQASIYPGGRMQPVLLKGIPPDQRVLELPTALLQTETDGVPALIGSGMAKSSKLKEGDFVIIRWRDKKGTFDATGIRIVGIFETNVPTVDVGQVWLPIEALRSMLLLPGEATLLVSASKEWSSPHFDQWIYRDQEFLMADMENIIKSKSMVSVIIWAILLMMAMLAVFDTQVLSIFRRQKEIGMYVALGMTRSQVVRLFTVEGAMHSVLAALLTAVYGLPFLTWQAVRGINIPVEGSDFGIAMAARLYPVYSLALVTGTILVVLVVTTLVSYWPARKIARLNPTEALRGRLQ